MQSVLTLEDSRLYFARYYAQAIQLLQSEWTENEALLHVTIVTWVARYCNVSLYMAFFSFFLRDLSYFNKL